MKQRIKKIAVLILLGIFVVMLANDYPHRLKNYNTASKKYYEENTLKEISSKNIVTGIYLDYRLFDSVFEAGILFVTVTGIAFMVKKDDDLE
jgi:multicomponent Na+:H+ antiporter subunit B